MSEPDRVGMNGKSLTVLQTQASGSNLREVRNGTTYPGYLSLRLNDPHSLNRQMWGFPISPIAGFPLELYSEPTSPDHSCREARAEFLKPAQLYIQPHQSDLSPGVTPCQGA